MQGPMETRNGNSRTLSQFPSFRWVVNNADGQPLIGVSSYTDAVNQEVLRASGAKSILRLARHPFNALHPKEPPPGIVARVEDFAMGYGEGRPLAELSTAVDKLQSLVASDPPVLVHCANGRVRSPFVVAGYLMKTTGCTIEEALPKVVPPDANNIRLHFSAELPVLAEFERSLRPQPKVPWWQKLFPVKKNS